ncbi:AraC family transcriptional regulator [Mycobacterium paragordonae]|jgi:AraC-like DNA-binding protein|uniref:AraC family transcriptional regulator n=1 Tax=Mycobacterium paragordonae TaxID=1389713 RepID=UPI0012E177CE|nr:AraC family transcriptional regulator [Mycobacterium paragordonae]
MSTPELPLKERSVAADIVAEIARKAPDPGANAGAWPGLTFYRFTAPQAPQWDEVQSLSLCVVAQGRKAVTANGIEYQYDPFNYFVFNKGMRFQAEILQASVEEPFMSLVMQIDPTLVRRVSADMRDSETTVFRKPSTFAARPDAYVCPLDQNLMGAILRFVRAVNTGADRRVLGPIYLQEIVYRLLQAEQYHHLIESASSQIDSNPVSAAVEYVRAHLDQPITVNELAERVCMSPSAFAHFFRESIGVSPYQFVKGVRLERARMLLVEDGLSVNEAARRVGYSSLSHFTNEFKRRYGVTPREYADLQRGSVSMQVSLRTAAH